MFREWFLMFWETISLTVIGVTSLPKPTLNATPVSNIQCFPVGGRYLRYSSVRFICFYLFLRYSRINPAQSQKRGGAMHLWEIPARRKWHRQRLSRITPSEKISGIDPGGLFPILHMHVVLTFDGVYVIIHHILSFGNVERGFSQLHWVAQFLSCLGNVIFSATNHVPVLGCFCSILHHRWHRNRMYKTISPKE
jgi:hypothetical protein